MSPLNAKVVVKNKQAIQFDDENKCIWLWSNALAGTEYHPMWEKVGKAVNEKELDTFVHPSIYQDTDLEGAILWFWYDMASL